MIRHDPTQSSFTTLLLRYASRKWKNKVRRRIVHQSVSISNITAKSRTQAEIAIWTSEIFHTRSSNIDFRIQGPPQTAVQEQDDIRRETVKKLIQQFETHPNRKYADGRPREEPKIQSAHREVEGINPQHGKRGVLRDVGDHIYSTMPRLLTLFGKQALYTVLAVNTCNFRPRIED